MTGWRGRNSCRKFSSKMRWILKKPQLERVPGEYWVEYHLMITLADEQAVGDSALSTFAQHCNNIERLNLRNCKKLSDRTCQFLARHCSKLQVQEIKENYLKLIKYKGENLRYTLIRYTIKNWNLRFLTFPPAHRSLTTPSVLSPMVAHRWAHMDAHRCILIINLDDHDDHGDDDQDHVQS